MTLPQPLEGILPVNKPKGRTSFTLVADLRRLTGVKKIGHAGTLDPFATGVMVMLIGKNFTKLSDQFIGHDKEYTAIIKLGETTSTYDCDSDILTTSSYIPTLEEIHQVLARFQGEIEQIPPMYSAKKVQGKKLYELARKGIEIARQPVKITLTTTLIDYAYPHLTIRVACTKGTYIRTLGHDIGQALSCGGHLIALERTRSGTFTLADCFDGHLLRTPECTQELIRKYLRCA